MNKKTITISLLVLAIVIIPIMVIIFTNLFSTNETDQIIDYKTCENAGGRIQESYPARCVTDDGRSFVQPIE